MRPEVFLQNYTQNIDTLESLAGVKNVLQCHGSFATASCLLCRRCVPGVEIEADILRQRVPLCTVCNSAPAESSKGKKKAKKSKKIWNSDEEDESDGPLYPPGIMKVGAGISKLVWPLNAMWDSLISHSLGKS